MRHRRLRRSRSELNLGCDRSAGCSRGRRKTREHAFRRAIDPANRILGQDASKQATLLVEPAEVLLFEQPETALRYYEVAAIQRIDQRVERISAQYVKP